MAKNNLPKDIKDHWYKDKWAYFKREYYEFPKGYLVQIKWHDQSRGYYLERPVNDGHGYIVSILWANENNIEVISKPGKLFKYLYE